MKEAIGEEKEAFFNQLVTYVRQHLHRNIPSKETIVALNSQVTQIQEEKRLLEEQKRVAEEQEAEWRQKYEALVLAQNSTGLLGV